MNCLFCKIASGEIPTNLTYEDELVLGFNDINPQAEIHQIFIPREHIATANDLAPQHTNIIANLFLAAAQAAKEKGIAEKGYRLVMNCNPEGGQSVYHIHLHLLGGRRMSWPPG